LPVAVVVTCSAPSWFSVLWKVVAPLLHENTRRKINIIGRDYSPMLECIDAESLPVKYGGRDTMALGQAPEEVAYLKYTEDLNKAEPSPPRTPSQPSQSRSSSRAPTPSPGLGAPASSVPSSPLAGNSDTNGAGLGQRLLGWGQGLVGSLGTLRTRLALGSDELPVANLGQENKFVYDEQRRMWVLSSPEEEPAAVDEAEERLIRAIQAAHGFVPEGRGVSDAEAEGVRAGRSPSPAAASVQTAQGSTAPLMRGSGLGLGAGSRASRSRAGALLAVVLAWRGVSVALLVVVPLWMRDMTAPGTGTTALVMAGAALLGLGLWTLDAVLRGPQYPQASPYRAALMLVFTSVGLLALSDPLTGGDRQEAVPAVNGFGVALGGLALLSIGGASGWATVLKAGMGKQEGHEARFDLLAPVALADLAGAVAGPLVYSALYQEGGHGLFRGTNGLFDVATLVGLVSLPLISFVGYTTLRVGGRREEDV
jgi:hypothetical protein